MLFWDTVSNLMVLHTSLHTHNVSWRKHSQPIYYLENANRNIQYYLSSVLFCAIVLFCLLLLVGGSLTFNFFSFAFVLATKLFQLWRTWVLHHRQITELNIHSKGKEYLSKKNNDDILSTLNTHAFILLNVTTAGM